jgi:hypothetical protein
MRSKLLLLAVCFCACFGGAGLGGEKKAKPAGGDDREELFKSKVKAAESAYRRIRAAYENAASLPTTELCYVWSKRVLEAESQLNPGPASRLDALKRHLARMEEIDAHAKKRVSQDLAGQLDATAYFVSEAKLWLADAKGKPKESK